MERSPSSTRARLRRLREAIAVLPDAHRARRALAREQDVRALLAALDATPVRGHGKPAALLPVCRGARTAINLLRYADAGRCLYASLTLYIALRRRGFSPTFVSGVRREPQGIVGHAWVVLDDRILDLVGDPERCDYVETLRHPATGTPADTSAGGRQAAQR